jgi:ATP-dependent Clp protease ATP-binding subunit ClpX
VSSSSSVQLGAPDIRAADIRRHLDEFVVGQQSAKERLSLLLSMHRSWCRKPDAMHKPPNGMIIGPTGNGKTYSIKVASSFLTIPFLTVDSTSLVPHGARSGRTIEEVLENLSAAAFSRYRGLDKSFTDVVTREQYASSGVIFFDEFDKLAIREGDPNREWKADVQRTLLKFVEGFSARTADSTIQTNGILVIVGGAFSGIDAPENTRKRRSEVEKVLRGAPKGTIVSDDVVNFGFMPELVARIPAIIQLEPLSEAALLQILAHPSASPLLVWEHHFSRLGKKIVFSDGFRVAVARRASALQLGARALQQTVFPALSRKAYAFEEHPD